MAFADDLRDIGGVPPESERGRAVLDAGNLIWVFTTASSVEIGPSLHWRGSILAPPATVTMHNSVPLDGSLIASSVLGAVTHYWLPPVDHPQMP